MKTKDGIRLEPLIQKLKGINGITEVKIVRYDSMIELAVYGKSSDIDIYDEISREVVNHEDLIKTVIDYIYYPEEG